MNDKRRLPVDDDGRVIAPMNVEGMPWYEGTPMMPSGSAGETLDRRQTRFAIIGALKASLLIAGVFSAGLILFVLFCTEIWLK